MENSEHEFFNSLGKGLATAEVQALVQRFSLTEVDDAPPFRCYVGSSARGMDLLFEKDRLLAIQIYARPSQGFSAFDAPLPFGIQGTMSQAQVHDLLGIPAEADKFDSKFIFQNMSARLVVSYDAKGVLSLHIDSTRIADLEAS